MATFQYHQTLGPGTVPFIIVDGESPQGRLVASHNGWCLVGHCAAEQALNVYTEFSIDVENHVTVTTHTLPLGTVYYRAGTRVCRLRYTDQRHLVFLDLPGCPTLTTPSRLVDINERFVAVIPWSTVQSTTVIVYQLPQLTRVWTADVVNSSPVYLVGDTLVYHATPSLSTDAVYRSMVAVVDLCRGTISHCTVESDVVDYRYDQETDLLLVVYPTKFAWCHLASVTWCELDTGPYVAWSYHHTLRRLVVVPKPITDVATLVQYDL